jgi:hypothetical protein
MADLFQSVSGAVIKSKTNSPTFLSVDGLDQLLKGGKLLLTSIRITRAQDVQFLKTLSNLYYIYAFGESPGTIQVGGLVFFSDCNSKSISGDSIGEINKFYDDNNAYEKKGTTRISGGNGMSFNTILTGVSISGDMTPYNYASFSLSFTLIPPK